MQRPLTESERCPRVGSLASHEITKQIEAYRLPSSNILSGCRDLQISCVRERVCVCLMDIKEKSDDHDHNDNDNVGGERDIIA